MQHTPEFYAGQFGLERETLRVDRQGRLAQTPHPFEEEAHITRDFCENQIELITPVCRSIPEMLEALKAFDARTRSVLAEQHEQIWLYSNPPHFETEADIPVADFRGEHANKRSYRNQLELRYGKRLMLFSGIHFNFSFSDAWLQKLHADTGGEYQAFVNDVYLRMYKQLCLHSWLIVLLTAASPLYDASLDADHASGIIRSPYTSLRNSERGYWNEFTPILDHSSLQAFVESIQFYVDKGALFSASEIYLPIRLKPREKNTLQNLLTNGIDHIELRMFDLNPLAPLGIAPEDAAFAHLLILYLSLQPDFDYSPALQEQAVADHKAAARADLSEVRIGGVPILEQAGHILDRMQDCFSEDTDAQRILHYERQKLTNPIWRQITEAIFQPKE